MQRELSPKVTEGLFCLCKLLFNKPFVYSLSAPEESAGALNYAYGMKIWIAEKRNGERLRDAA